MNETANNDGASTEPEKPVTANDDVKFPPFPEPTDEDFDDDVTEDERNYYKNKFPDLNAVKTFRLHCTACDRHLGSSARNECRMRAHPMLRTLVCQTCHTFYNSGEFEKGDDGSELYCRWCGQGGQVYCCSDCPHVFCAKCIKRNLGTLKIKEIENADDWKCFKCKPECLKELRAVCWALLRYCDLKNKITYKTEDPILRETYQKDCAQDFTDCCKNKGRRKEKVDALRKRDIENLAKKATATIISKIPSTIQVKKFASINLDDVPKQEKKAPKRSASPKNKQFIIKNPISVAPCPRMLTPISLPPPVKKIRMSNPPHILNTHAIRYVNDNRSSPATYSRIRPKLPMNPIPIMSNFNGYNNTGVYNNLNNMLVSDNINLSLENLTQGLDMAAVAAMSNNNSSQDDDVVCTPDFPMEPLCEVTEDNDDDVQCITPSPVGTAAKSNNPPPLIARGSALNDLTSDNIIQMTDNDVTVNAATGGLKFRVDPQTLSSNKMYRLPDGRVFAINANPNMPGGYSATIVAVTETTGKSVAPKGATYAAKLSAVSSSQVSTPATPKTTRIQTRSASIKRSTPKPKSNKKTDTSSRECDLNVPVEWYRYNLIDAVDALEYSLSRLQKLKKEATTMYLRTRSVGEMRSLHRTLERLLNTSSCRFNEIRDNLNKELKQYVLRKMGDNNSEDDDDVEILPDLENEDPIFIDENSIDSNVDNESREVDLTGAATSEHNESGEKNDDALPRMEIDPLNFNEEDNTSTIVGNDTTGALLNNTDSHVNDNDGKGAGDKQEKMERKENTEKQDNMLRDNEKDYTSTENRQDTENKQDDTSMEKQDDVSAENKKDDNDKSDDEEAQKNTEANDPLNSDSSQNKESLKDIQNELEESDEKQDGSKEIEEMTDDERKMLNCKTASQDNDDKTQESEMSEEMIETLLKDDNDVDNAPNSSFDIPELKET